MPSLSWNEIRQRAKVEECAQQVLDARQPHLDNSATLAAHLPPRYMPAHLLKAHQNLDRAVDRCYRREMLERQREPVCFLFGLCEAMTSDWHAPPELHKPTACNPIAIQPKANAAKAAWLCRSFNIAPQAMNYDRSTLNKSGRIVVFYVGNL